MCLLAAKTCLVLSALLLIPLGVSAQMACCAGMASIQGMEMDGNGCADGMTCCDKAQDDALARRCCEGGERLDRSHAVPRACAAPPAVLPAPPTLDERTLVGVCRDALPPPLATELFTLHSAFLI